MNLISLSSSQDFLRPSCSDAEKFLQLRLVWLQSNSNLGLVVSYSFPSLTVASSPSINIQVTRSFLPQPLRKLFDVQIRWNFIFLIRGDVHLLHKELNIIGCTLITYLSSPISIHLANILYILTT